MLRGTIRSSKTNATTTEAVTPRKEHEKNDGNLAHDVAFERIM
jgi:hypothetical protein